MKLRIAGLAAALCLALCLTGCGKRQLDNENQEQSEAILEQNTREVTDDSEENVAEKATDEESEAELIDKMDYKYDDDNYITVAIMKDYGTSALSVAAYGVYEEGNLGLAQYDYMTVTLNPMIKKIDFGYFAGVGGESYGNVFENGETIMDNIPSEMEEMPTEYVDKAVEFGDELTDFYIKYGIAEKTEETGTDNQKQEEEPNSAQNKSAFQQGRELSNEISDKLESIDWEENYEKAGEAGEKAAEWLNKFFE